MLAGRRSLALASSFLRPGPAASTSGRHAAESVRESDLRADTLGLYRGLLAGDRSCLARSITLVESTNPAKREESRKLVTLATRHSRDVHLDAGTFRIGLSGPPGAGKSTFIEAVGKLLTAKGHKVAVLAVDPSSSTQGGSLLGDKTRMPRLSVDPAAYIRPSPSGGHLGGVTRSTNESIVLCEVCGFDVVLVETVGVGQSEIAVADMVDAFCLLLPPASGDELQGIKRGIVERSDLVLVNKSDGDLLPAARRTASGYTSALKLMRPRSRHWKTEVQLVSSKTGDGLEESWRRMCDFKAAMVDCGEFAGRRRGQRKKWMWNFINDRLLEIFKSHPAVRENSRHLEEMVTDLSLSPGTASDVLIGEFLSKSK